MEVRARRCTKYESRDIETSEMTRSERKELPRNENTYTPWGILPEEIKVTEICDNNETSEMNPSERQELSQYENTHNKIQPDETDCMTRVRFDKSQSNDTAV